MNSSTLDRYSYVGALTLSAANKTSIVGTTIDRMAYNNGSDSLTFVVEAVSITDGTHVFSIQDSNDGTVWNNVNAPYVKTGANGATFTSVTQAGNTVKLCYLGNDKGSSRYVRLAAAGSGATGGLYDAIAVLGINALLPAS